MGKPVSKCSSVVSKGQSEIVADNLVVNSAPPSASLTQMSKLYKWKKINYKTKLPKHAPVVFYIVAKANTYERSLTHFGSWSPQPIISSSNGSTPF